MALLKHNNKTIIAIIIIYFPWTIFYKKTQTKDVTRFHEQILVTEALNQ